MPLDFSSIVDVAQGANANIVSRNLNQAASGFGSTRRNALMNSPFWALAQKMGKRRLRTDTFTQRFGLKDNRLGMTRTAGAENDLLKLLTTVLISHLLK